MSYWRFLFGEGWREVEAAERRWQLVAVVGLAGFALWLVTGLMGCATQPVAVDPVVIERPVPVPCAAPAVPEPAWPVDSVQLTGHPETDLVLVERAKESEIELRRAYELKLKAALDGCR